MRLLVVSALDARAPRVAQALDAALTLRPDRLFLIDGAAVAMVERLRRAQKRDDDRFLAAAARHVLDDGPLPERTEAPLPTALLGVSASPLAAPFPVSARQVELVRGALVMAIQAPGDVADGERDNALVWLVGGAGSAALSSDARTVCPGDASADGAIGVVDVDAEVRCSLVSLDGVTLESRVVQRRAPSLRVQGGDR